MSVTASTPAQSVPQNQASIAQPQACLQTTLVGDNSVCDLTRMLTQATTVVIYRRERTRGVIVGQSGITLARTALPWAALRPIERSNKPLAIPEALALRLFGAGYFENNAYGLIAATSVRARDGRCLGVLAAHVPKLHASRLVREPTLLFEQLIAASALVADQLSMSDDLAASFVNTKANLPAIVQERGWNIHQRQRLAEDASQLAHIGFWEIRCPSLEFFWSDEVYRIFGLEPGVSITPAAILSYFAPEYRQDFGERCNDAIRFGRKFSLEFQAITEDQRDIWVVIKGDAEIVDGQVTRVFGYYHDITEEKKADLHLQHMAHHDALTGLPNRAVFQKQLKRAAARASRRNGQLALLMFDLDRFKEINDTLGHDAGDAVLVEIAKRVRYALRSADLVARLGGDEFVVLAQVTGGVKDAIDIARRILECAASPVAFRDEWVDVDLSVGIALYPDGHCTDIDQLMQNGDLALYRAKSKGRSRYCLFDPLFRSELEQRRHVLISAQEGLKANQFEMFYQPVVRVLDAQTSSFEALLRWRHPVQGILSPYHFLAALQDSEVSALIGDVVLDMVSRQAALWHAQALPFSRIALNVSQSQFRNGDFAERVLETLARHNVPPWCITIEVTETVLLGHESDHVAQALQRLQDEGVAIALDDFGTGYASLTHLKSFPVDRIKIDRSFVQSMLLERDSAQIVRAIIELAHALGIEVVAEGVENMEIANVLRTMGCDFIQGYAYGKPACANEATALLMQAIA
jgi:diguanylate cyclase (GGDEF)-like protein